MDERQHASASGSPDDDLEISVSPLRPEAQPSGERPRRFGGRFWYRLVGMVVLGALLVGIFVWVYPRLPRPQPLPDPLTLNTAGSGGLPCTIDGAAWSPDSARIALVGDSACPLGQGQTPDLESESEMLAIVDAATGRRVSSVSLGPAVIARLTSTAQLRPKGGIIDYSQPVWSPDGRSIVVTFAVFAFQEDRSGNETGPHLYRFGLVVVTVASGRERVLIAPTVESLPPGVNDVNIVQRWDLVHGSEDILYVPPALTYRWTAAGTLTSSDLLSAASDVPPPAPRGGPVGNPIGGSSFSLWQNGSVLYYVSSGCPSGSGDTNPPSLAIACRTTMGLRSTCLPGRPMDATWCWSARAGGSWCLHPRPPSPLHPLSLH